MSFSQIMVSMGNASTCCPSLHRSGNMNRSGVSSASSGSEKQSGSGVESSAGYGLEGSKAKSNSRMSCASDDSCAINELLEGRMDLNVTLPNSANPVVINVERRTPMLDLLVNISTQYRFNAANFTIDAGDHEFKASTPIGTLDVNQISIIPKTLRSGSLKSNGSVVTTQKPFQTTFRLQVNLPRNQLMVMRVTPNATIAAIKQIICTEKALDADKYQLVRFANTSDGPQLLEPTKSLAFYTLNEVTLVSNKTLSQIELQYGNPSASQVDASRASSTGAWVERKVNNSMLISQSNPDFTTIDDKTVLKHMTSAKQQKKRPAPPPPAKSSSVTLPNKSLSAQMNAYNDDNNVMNSKKSDSIDNSIENLTQTIIETKPVRNAPKSAITHVRQNSGSDSSGYHESVLSSDSPESSSAPTLQKSSSTTAEITANKQLSNKSGTKKRRAPPPPPSGALHVNSINGKPNDHTIDESKATHECLSDVSLPLSMSSSSSGTTSSTSSINNRSLSPIVITQTNGSSTPIQSSDNLKVYSIDSESTPLSPTLKTTQSIESPDECSAEAPEQQRHVICGVNESNVESETHLSNTFVDLQHSAQTDCINNEVESAVTHDRPLDIDINSEDMSNENNKDLNSNDSDITCDSSTTKSTESPTKVEVSCIAPAPAVSDQCTHKFTEQVVERDQIIASSKAPTGWAPTAANNRLHDNDFNVNYNNEITNGLDIKSKLDNNRRTYMQAMKGGGDLKLMLSVLTGVIHNTNEENSDNQSHNDCAIDPTLINSELDMSVPLPPPSPFQNSNHEESDCHSERQTIEEPIEDHNSIPDNSTNEQSFKAKPISEQKMINTFDNNIETNDKTIEMTKSSDSDIVGTETESNTTTTCPLIVNDEDTDDTLNREIEVTLQSLNEELDRLDSCDPIDENNLIVKQSVVVNHSVNDYPSNGLNSNANNQINDKTPDVSVYAKEVVVSSSDIEAIKSKFESRVSPAPSPTPRCATNKLNMNIKDENKPQIPSTTNGKTTVIVNKSPNDTQRPLSPQTPSVSPIPINEDKLSITEEVKQLCRPRVRLTNFSIGSYKKELDIFEEMPKLSKPNSAVTAPVVNTGPKSFVTFPSMKKEEKTRPAINQNKSKVNITSTSTTITTTTHPKPKTPVIQTLITSAPKINRIQSWSGQKANCLEEKNIKQPTKQYEKERYVSQIAINKEINDLNKNKELNEDLMSPQLVVQTLVAKTEDRLKHRSPSPNEPMKEAIKEHTTISIKPGLESIIRSNSKQNNSEKFYNEMNSKQIVSQNYNKHSNQTPIESKKINEEKVQALASSPVPPPVPPPIPPPVPQNTSLNANNSSINKINTKIFHTKGWNSDKGVRSGEVPKVKHVEPPTNVNVRDQLLNEIKSFGGKNSLKKVSKNTSWKLEVNAVSGVSAVKT